MGLDVSYDCWHGSYGSFHAWRCAIAEAAMYGNLNDYDGYTKNGKPWPINDPLVILLSHSDCDGSIDSKDCGPLADRLEAILPVMHDEWTVRKTEFFIKGLRSAAALGESVEFC